MTFSENACRSLMWSKGKMSQINRYALALSLLLFLNGSIVNSCTSKSAGDEVNILTSSASPDNEYVATFYNVSGGGAAGYVYMLVNLRRRSEPFDPKEGIIVQMTRSYEVNLKWDDNEHLTVGHSKEATMYLQVKEWGTKRKIQIRYVEE